MTVAFAMDEKPKPQCIFHNLLSFASDLGIHEGKCMAAHDANEIHTHLHLHSTAIAIERYVYMDSVGMHES